MILSVIGFAVYYSNLMQACQVGEKTRRYCPKPGIMTRLFSWNKYKFMRLSCKAERSAEMSRTDFFLYLAYGVFFKPRNLRLRDTYLFCNFHLRVTVVKPQGEYALFAL